MVQVLIHASEILSGAGIREKGGRRVTESDVSRIADGAVVFDTRRVMGKTVPNKILWVGESRALPAQYRRCQTRDLKRKSAIIPGMIDCHTHLVFAGDRSEEFARRCAGATYEEIAAAGGGILSTVRSTRSASVSELERTAIARVKEARGFGVRTLEIKSGYGLSHESELKILEVIHRLRKRFPEMTFVSTYLGAHAFPPDQSPEEYVNEIVERTLPEVARRGLAEFCDVFVDTGYFTPQQGKRVLKRAIELGLGAKLHADELANTESAALAAELKASSADHLLRISDQGLSRLARSETVAVLLPGTAFYLKAPHAPARKLLDAGARVALATDFNPGSCMTLSLPSVMTIAALYLGMSRAELLAAVTYNAARALGLEERKGTIAPGMDADLTILPFAKFEETYYRFAWSGGTTLR